MPTSSDPPFLVTDPIRKGSIVVFRNGQFDEETEMPAVIQQLKLIADHDRFLILCLEPDMGVSVHGPQDMKDALIGLISGEVQKQLEALKTGDANG
jgi:hypothetical protein